MQLPQLNFETAFAMTALFSWALVGLLWVVVRIAAVSPVT